MAITVPAPGQDISAEAFGIPVANQLNGSVPTAWTGLAFQGGWTNYGAGNQTGQYRKIGDIVYVRGNIKSPGAAGIIAILPVGFRPVLAQEFPCSYYNGSARVVAVVAANIDGSLYAADVVNLNGLLAIATISFSISA